MATKILKSLLIAALLGCAVARAADATHSAAGPSNATAPFKVSELQCHVVEGQIRCTFG